MRHFTLSVFVLLIGLISQSYPQEIDLCSRAKSVQKFISQPSTLTAEQKKIDIQYYRIEIDIETNPNYIEASVFTRLTVTDSTLSSVELDFWNQTQVSITVAAVLMNGNVSTFTHQDHRINIPVSENSSMGDTIEVEIQYAAGPLPNSNNWAFNFDRKNGHDLIWTLSEPFGARTWWPCKDDPSDKADSVDFIVTVPEELIVASNGRLISNIDNGDDTRTYHWFESYPIATYLVSLAIYPYFVWYDEYISANNDTMPIEFYTYLDTSEYSSNFVENYLKTENMMSVFSNLFGEYPFIDEKYGHAMFGRGGGMEHQTLTSLGGSSEGLIAHELAHQWWGDLVTCASFHHIWLNEGFATYSEALWVEARYGIEWYHKVMDNFAFFGSGTIYVERPQSENIFDGSLSYRKASWILHMLRHIVGDSTFFEILKTYRNTPGIAYSSATTEQFKNICEAVSGKELDQFFGQWVYGKYYPEYLVAWTQNEDSLLVSIEQTQFHLTKTAFFMPIDLKIVCPDTTFIHVVDNHNLVHHYSIPIPSGKSVTDLIVDPDKWILRKVEFQKYVDVKHSQEVPLTYALHSAYPNPFNPVTTIRYDLPEQSFINLTIYNILGKKVRTLVNDLQGAGNRSVIWNGTDEFGRSVGTGIYLYQIRAEDFNQTRRMVLLK